MIMLKDKLVVITGGAGLLGSAFVTAVIENSGMAIIADIDKEKSIHVKNALAHRFNSNAIDIAILDIASKASIQEMLRSLHEKYGKIDALVNNAYPRNNHYGRSFFDVEFDDFCENVGIHLGGYFLVSQQMAAYFQVQGYGNIINMASIYGVVAPRFEIYEGAPMTMPVEYAAIKSAILHLTKYMAKYFKGMNIRVNAISPGGIFQDQPEIFLRRYNDLALSKGMLNASDLIGTLIYLLSDYSQYVNGQNIIVDDGWSL